MTIDVSAGILLREGRVLLCQRSHGETAGLWEFPGGKRLPGESAEACLRRECFEELAIRLRVDALLAAFDWPAQEGRTLHFSFFLASLQEGTPQCLEHRQIRWVRPGDLDGYPLCPADASVLPRLMEAFRAAGE